MTTIITDDNTNNKNTGDDTVVVVELTMVVCPEFTTTTNNVSVALRNQWQKLVQKVGCREASSSGANSNDNNNNNNNNNDDVVSKDMEKNIFKFLKWEDQYMAMNSCLLKSRAYYQSSTTTTTSQLRQQQLQRPVINLPRTQYKKPYIPCSNSCSCCNDGGCDFSVNNNNNPISISHQFPYAGITRTTRHRKQNDHHQQQQQQLSYKLGFDIVMFEYNQRLYEDVKEFVNVFQDLFHPNEFETIMNICDKTTIHDDNDNNFDTSSLLLLQEFALRWAVKEAYTKALGIGLGIEFSSFLFHFYHNDDQDGCGNTTTTVSSLSQLLHQIKNIKNEYVSVQGKLEWPNGKDPNHPDNEGRDSDDDNLWYFAFYPLYDDNGSSSSNNNNNNKANKKLVGCACSCIGPMRKANNKEEGAGCNNASMRLEVEWMTLDELCNYHANV